MKNILVADDEKFIREGIAGSIKKEFGDNVNVFTARNGKLAFEMICSSENQIDIVLTDIIMPELSRLELIQNVREKGIPCEFIILSSYDDFSYAQKAIRTGVCEYILKPCENKMIFDTIRKVSEKIENQKKEKNFSKQTINSMLGSWFDGKINFSEVKNYIAFDSNANSKSNSTAQTARLFVIPYIMYKKSEQSCFNVISKIQEKIENAVCFFKESHIFILIPAKNYSGKNFSCSQLIKLLEEIKENESCNQPIIISEVFTPESENSQIFSKIKETISLLYYFKERSTIYTESINFLQNPPQEKISQIYKELAEKLFNSENESEGESPEIKKNEIEGLENELKKILELCAKKMYSFEALKKLTLNFFLFYFAQSKAYKSSDINELISVDRISNATSLEKLFLAAKEAVLSISKNQTALSTGNFTKQVRKVIDYVEKNYSNPALSLQKITQEQVYMNVDYLGKLFKRETGEKFSNFVLEKRIEKAKLFMEDVDLSIAEIADMTGFSNNPSYFSQIFRKVTGLTPREYREKHQGFRIIKKSDNDKRTSTTQK